MSHRIAPPLIARNGKKLICLGIARISGGPHQTEKSLEDQEALYRSWLGSNTDVPFDLKMIAGTGSGEYLDRKEVEEAQRELESGKYDLVILEDIGRFLRRMHAFLFCETAEDAGRRLRSGAAGEECV